LAANTAQGEGQPPGRGGILLLAVKLPSLQLLAHQLFDVSTRHLCAEKS